jgi:hypothetical protein
VLRFEMEFTLKKHTRPQSLKSKPSYLKSQEKILPDVPPADL